MSGLSGRGWIKLRRSGEPVHAVRGSDRHNGANRVFGCDINQEVCPFTTRFSTPSSDPLVRSELDGALERFRPKET
jgi:epoxyqueuosine reductase QueG